MPINRSEQMTRAFIGSIFEQLGATPVSDKDVIRGAALALFTKELEGKIANLQDDETIQLTFRIDIIDTNGQVRGGSGAQRNMPEYIQWRDAVYQRDGYKCRDCGSSKNINAHHVKTWHSTPESRFDVANGETLCFDCHAKRHPHLRIVTHGQK